MLSRKKAAIVGCGSIAGFLDSPHDKYITTHAHAYLAHPDTELVAVCDTDAVQRENFVKRWGNDIKCYDSLTELLLHEKIDILSICSPTPFHAEALRAALQDKHISAILCEKPFVNTQEELDEARMLLRESKKKVLINFMRRYDPSIQELKKILDSKIFGELLHFNANFTKGLHHNGSHMLELIEYLCGPIKTIQANSIRLAENDIYGAFYLETASTHGSVHNESGENYALFELELILSKGRIQIKDSGHTIQLESIQASKQYPGYFKLEYDKTLTETMNANLYNSLNSLLDDTNTDEILERHLQLSQKLLSIKESLFEKKLLEYV